jgi:seryl-tRNA synthetase
MNLREKVIKAYTDTYTENEEVIVRNLLQTGRIDEEEWQEIAEQLTELAEAYRNSEKTPEQFIKGRKQVRKKFNKSGEEKKAGLTRDEAENLYHQIKEQQQQTLEKAYKESGYSTLRIAGKILSARLKFIAARLKNI